MSQSRVGEAVEALECLERAAVAGANVLGQRWKVSRFRHCGLFKFGLHGPGFYASVSECLSGRVDEDDFVGTCSKWLAKKNQVPMLDWQHEQWEVSLGEHRQFWGKDAWIPFALAVAWVLEDEAKTERDIAWLREQEALLGKGVG